MKYGPLSYYRLGQAFPRSESREFYRDHRKIRLIVATAPVRIPIHWATTGAAQGLGDGSSEANRIELKKVIENDPALRQALVAGDTINCKDDGELVYDGSLDPFAVLSVAGSSGIGRILIRGYTTTPGDGGIIEIRDSNLGSTNHCINFNSKSFYYFRNITLKNTRFAYNMGTTFGHSWHKCSVLRTFLAATDINAWVQGSATGAGCVWSQCVVMGDGLNSGPVTGWSCDGRANQWINCAALECETINYQSLPVIHPGVFVNCISTYCNTGPGFEISSTVLVNCLSIGNAVEGFLFRTPDIATLINCISADNKHGVGSNSSLLCLAINCNLEPKGFEHSTSIANNIILTEVNDDNEGNVDWLETIPPITGDLAGFTPGSDSSLLSSAMKFHPLLINLNDFGTIGPIERQEPGAAGVQGIFRYYTGLLPVTKMEDLI